MSPESGSRYRIQDLLGVGGMGQVYRALDTRLDRPVALKLLRGGDAETEERMLREARAQARVEHPNVCRVLEAGKLDGKPFIAMQLVDGVPIDEATGSDLRQTIDLMRRVAEAVQAAHSQGLVHRDLKPGNILVEEREGELEPVVVDFGLAIEPAEPGLTRTGVVRGTPGFMAPEQISGPRDRIDRRTDVYALGAVLYQLLAGRPPHEGETPVEVMMQATSREPPSLRSLADGVPRDLAVVVHKCLQRDPDRRYSSARLLAEDLERLLAGEPVLARAPSWSYRAAKAIHRHRGRAVAVAVVLVILLIGGVKYTVDLRRERAAAVTAREEAEEVTGFLVDLLEGAGPREARGRDVTVRELVDRAAERIDIDLGGRPAVEARITEVLGSLYMSFGELERSEELVSRALEMRQTPGGRASSLNVLADVRYWQGDYEEAEELYRRSLALRRKVDTALTAAPLHGLGKVAIETGRLDEARSLLEELVRIRRATEAQPHQISAALGELGRAEREAGLFDEAEAHLEESLELLEPYGEDDPRRLAALSNLGMIHHQRGQLSRAAETFEELVALERELLGEEHYHVATTLTNLARTFRTAGRYDRAEELYAEVLAIYEETVGPDHQWMGVVLNNLGKLHRDLGRFELAREELERALEILVPAVGENASRTAIAYLNLGQVEMDLGRFEEAKTLLDRGVTGLRRNGERHPFVGIGLEIVGDLHLRSGRIDEALATLEEALSIQEEAFGSDHTRTARCRARWAWARLESGDPEQALALANRSIESMERQVADRPQELQGARSLALALTVQARALEDLGRDPTSAYRRLAEILEPRQKGREVVEIAALYAEGLQGVGRAEEARIILRELAETGWTSGALALGREAPDGPGGPALSAPR